MNSTHRWIAGLPIAALAVVGALAFIGADSPRRRQPPVPRRHVVEIRGMAFHPEVLQVRRGDTVVWINRDIVPHTASGTMKPAWDTGSLPPGGTGVYVVHHEGAERYYCRLHPTMQGKLTAR